MKNRGSRRQLEFTTRSPTLRMDRRAHRSSDRRASRCIAPTLPWPAASTYRPPLAKSDAANVQEMRGLGNDADSLDGGGDSSPVMDLYRSSPRTALEGEATGSNGKRRPRQHERQPPFHPLLSSLMIGDDLRCATPPAVNSGYVSSPAAKRTELASSSSKQRASLTSKEQRRHVFVFLPALHGCDNGIRSWKMALYLLLAEFDRKNGVARWQSSHGLSRRAWVRVLAT
nr:hypothetical protein Itr_chr09CG14910 [Ipomoea trifida]